MAPKNGPVELALARAVGTSSLALHVECRIKKQTRAQKEQLIARKSLLSRILDAQSPLRRDRGND